MERIARGRGEGVVTPSARAFGNARNDIALALQTEPETTLTDEEVPAFYEGYGCAPLSSETRRWFVSLYEFF